MKKVLNYLLLLFIIIVPTKTFNADMAAPSEYNMSATCNVVDGCNYYDDYRLTKVVGKIEYQEEVEVEYYDDDYMSIEYERNTPYCDEDDEDCDEDEYDDYDTFYIKNSDFINTAKEEVTPDDKQIEHLSKSINMIIINKKGATIYKGPNEKFDSIGTAPYGFEYDVEYGFMGGEGYGTTTPIWAYVTYKGISGWVGIWENGNINGVYKLKSTQKYIAPKKVKFGSKSIPAGTVLNVDYAYMYTLYFEYDGEYASLDSDNLGFSTTEALKLKKKVTIYKQASTATSVATIPSGSILFPLYKYQVKRTESWYYVEYNGKKGWINVKYDDNSKVKIYYEGDKNYPERPAVVDDPKKDDEDKKTEDQGKEPEVEPEVIAPETEPTKEDKKSTNSFELKGVNLVIFCVGLAIVVAAVTAIVVLKFAKKND